MRKKIDEPHRARGSRGGRHRRAGRRRDHGDALRRRRHLARLARIPALCHRRCVPDPGDRDGAAHAFRTRATSCRSRARHRPVRHPDRAVELWPANRAGRARRAHLRELPAADPASFAALLGHERVTTSKIAGILATLLGVFLALERQDAGRRFSAPRLGQARRRACDPRRAATGAICRVLYRPYLARYPTLPVSAFAMAAAAAALLVPAALDDLFVAPAQLGATAWAAIVFIGLSSGVRSTWCGCGR